MSAAEGLSAGERLTAFSFMLDEILTLRDVEQGLDRMNRLGSNKVTVDIEADDNREGRSKLIVKNEPQGNTNVGATLDKLDNTATP
jgi:hemolysin activation/secretion protein